MYAPNTNTNGTIRRLAQFQSVLSLTPEYRYNQSAKRCNFDLVFILHPSIREVLRKKKLFKKLEGNKRIILKKRYPYFEFIKLLSKSEFLITDGGSNQEETAYMGKPCLLLKYHTGRPEGIGENAVMSYFDEKICLDFAKNYKEKERPFLNAKESPSKIIVEFLKNKSD